MRKDLNKLLCERERVGSSDEYGYYRHNKKYEDVAGRDDDVEAYFNVDETPFGGVGNAHRESMRARHNTRNFSENLNPLYGFIRKAAGRKWDKVYSEICEVFDKRSVINQHILIHLFQYVETKDIRVGEDGKLYHCPTMWGGMVPKLLKDSSVEYYVDPRDGILKYNYGRKSRRQYNIERAAERAAKEAETRRVIDSNTVLEKLNGCWFEVKYVDNKPEVVKVVIENPNAKRNWYYEKTIYRDANGNTVSDPKTRLAQRQLSHKELKRYGVTNG